MMNDFTNDIGDSLSRDEIEALKLSRDYKGSKAWEYGERKLAESVMARYFDTDIQDADSAMDVFLDNGVDATIAHEIADNMFPNKGESE
jgi:hypothetical protein